MPGHMGSADYYISQDPGRIYHTIDKSAPSDIFSDGCVFVDHSSGFMGVNNQVTINATETANKNHLLKGG